MGNCVQCLDTGFNWAVVAAGIVIVLGVASALVTNTYRSNVEGKAGSNVTPGLIRIFANYLKIQSTLGDFKVRAPAVIMAIRNGASTVSSGVPIDIGPVACAFGLNFERQLLGTVLMPLAIIISVSALCSILFSRAIFCPWVCRWTGPSLSSRIQSLWSRAPAAGPSALAPSSSAGVAPPSSPRVLDSNAAKVEAVIVQAAESHHAVPAESRSLVAGKYVQFCQSAITILLFLVYSMLVKQVFTAWRLYSEPIEDKWYLAADFAVSTDSPAYSRISIMAVVGVIFWVIGIPALAGWLLHRNRHRLLDDDFAASFAFLYAGYNIGTAGQVNETAIMQARAVVSKLKDLTSEDQKELLPAGRITAGAGRHQVSVTDASVTIDPATLTAAAAPTGVKSDAASPASASTGEGDQPPKKASGAARKVQWPLALDVRHLNSKHMRRKTTVASRGKNVAFLEDIVDQFEATVAGEAHSWWFWEVVVLARLVAVTIVAVFVEDVFVQSYLALGIVIASTVAHLAAHPYSDSSLNFAETMGLLTILVTQLGSLLWALDSTELANLDDTAVTVVLIVVNVLALLGFVIMLIFSILGETRILRIPVAGKWLSRAFFRERNLRRQFLQARLRRQELLDEHLASNAMPAAQSQKATAPESAIQAASTPTASTPMASTPKSPPA